MHEEVVFLKVRKEFFTRLCHGQPGKDKYHY
jgi:hypothetical protein